MYSLSKRQERDLLISEMKLSRTSYEAVWRDIANSYLPYRLRLTLTDINRGDRRNQNVYDSTIIRAVKTLESGFMTAATDPSSEWFTMGSEDKDRMEFGPHKQWFADTTHKLLSGFDTSNAYSVLPTGYGNSAGFGFFAMSIEESFKGKSPFHMRLIPTGQGWYGQDDESNVNTFYEEHRMTVRQLYLRFGERGDFSRQVTDMIDKGEWENWIDVGRLIKPNDDYKPDSPLASKKPYSSCWFELGNSSKGSGYVRSEDETVLLESGFDEFPIVVHRWDMTEGDIYPNDYPGVESLGDNKSLQIGEKRSWQGIDKLINPHWIAPESFRGTVDNGYIPGETSYVDERDAGKSIRPAHLMDPAFISPLEEKQNQVRTRIRECFHYPTFSTFDSLPDKTRTATEIMERKGEKLLKLVAPYTNLVNGALRPMVDRVFGIYVKRGMLPPPPPDLAGQQIEYKFNGVLAQAQKLSRVQPNQAMISFASQIANESGDPSVWRKINKDQAMDVIATNLGCDPSIIRSDEEVEQIAAQEQQAIAAQQQMAAMEQASKVAKNLAGSPLDERNALSALTGAR